MGMGFAIQSLSLSALRDMLDRLEDRLNDMYCEDPDDYDAIKALENKVNNLCGLIRSREREVAF